MKLIERKKYLDKMINVIGTPDIKVITGVRRSGKSKLLDAFKEYIEENIPNNNIIHINFNLPEYDHLIEYRSLYDYINSQYVKGKENFVFIDEVQMCNDFEKAINGLHATEKYDIYITGSNAFLLSSDLATLFTGRTFEIKVYPFSFSEYLQYFGYTDKYTAFDKYMLEGGMSGSYLYKDQEAKYDYIAEVFDTLIVRDIRRKYKIRNVQLMDRIVDYLMDNISNLSSARNITSTLKVAMELLRRGYEVYVGVLYKKEIDFVAIKRNEKIYIQVSDNITDEKTFEREVSPLLNIKDAYPKMIIARTRNPEYQYEGVKIVDIADWLSN